MRKEVKSFRKDTGTKYSVFKRLRLLILIITGLCCSSVVRPVALMQVLSLVIERIETYQKRETTLKLRLAMGRLYLLGSSRIPRDPLMAASYRFGIVWPASQGRARQKRAACAPTWPSL